MQPESTQSESLSNIEAYLQLCRNRTQNQQDLNREHSVKALGIITYSTTLLGVGASWVSPGDVTAISWTFLILSSICVVGIALSVLMSIIKPRPWKEPIKISPELLEEAGTAGQKTFLLELAKKNQKAIEHNTEVLEKRSSSLKWITRLTFVELLFIVGFRIFLLSPF